MFTVGERHPSLGGTMFRHHHHVYRPVTIFSLFPRFSFVYCSLLSPFCFPPHFRLYKSFLCYLSARSVSSHIYIQ